MIILKRYDELADFFQKNKMYAYCYIRHCFYIDATLTARAPISEEHSIKKLGGLCILNYDCKGVYVQPNFYAYYL